MKQAFRRLVLHPLRSFLVIGSLAIGLAGAATLWTVVERILLRPLPFHDPGNLVAVWAASAEQEMDRLELSFEEVELLDRDAESLASLGAYSAANFPIVAQIDGEPVQLKGNIVSKDFLATLGVSPAAGRPFRPEEHAPGAAPVALLSWGAAERAFGEAALARGAHIRLDETTTAHVVGILPRHSLLPDDAEILFPLEPGFADDNSRENRVLAGVARLREGVELEEAGRELEGIAARMAVDHPDSHKGIRYRARDLTGEILGDTGAALRILLGMALFLLLLATFNVANVLLIESVTRRTEMAVRRSLGASGWSMLRGTAAEVSIEAGAAAVLALLLVPAMVALLLRKAPEDLPRIGEVAFGTTSVVFIVAAAGAAGLVFCLVAGARRRSLATAEALHGGRATSTRRSRRTVDLLAALQIGVALVSLVVAALMIESFRRLNAIDVGFDRKGVVTAHLPTGYTLAPEPEKKRQMFRDVFSRIEALPGVSAVGSVLMRPLEMELGWDFAFTVEGQGAVEQEKNPMAALQAATPGYFSAMGIELLAGRIFTEADGPEDAKVAIISESFARRYWDPSAAVGRRIKSGPPDSDKPWITIVGVVPDVRSRGLTAEKLDIYVPYTQSNWSPNYLAIRTAGDPAALIEPVRRIVREMMPEVPLSSIRTTTELVDAKLAAPRLSAALVALFAGASLLLSLVGLYAVLEYAVRERTAELGLRLALGADRRGILRLVLFDAVRVALAGIAAGTAVAIVIGRLAASHLYRIDPVEPGIVLLAAGLLLATAVAACLAPAFRASRLDPMAALRSE